MIGSGALDAQENPLANTVVYGVHKLHRFHTLTGHFYISRPIFLNRHQFEAWPADLQDEMRAAVRDAITFQRAAAIDEHESARRAIEMQGCEIIELDSDQHRAFRDAVTPLLAETRRAYGKDMFDYVGAN